MISIAFLGNTAQATIPFASLSWKLLFFVIALSTTSGNNLSVQAFSPTSMVLDIFKPFYYYLEKGVASKSIPDVSTVPNRMRLADHPLKKGTLSFDHSAWDAVLKRHITVGESIDEVIDISTVDYAGITIDPDFAAYISLLEKADPRKLQPAEQLAFWMNAYNALCINLIVEHERKTGSSLNSINDLSQPGSPVWDMTAGKIAGKDISLNSIEHEMLRKKWAEPAVHACIVCASASCPNLRAEAFVANRVKDQMNDQVRNWLANTSKGLKLDGNRLELSRIFLWFEADFEGVRGIKKWVPSFVSDEKAGHKIARNSLAIRYFEYSWKMNRTQKEKKSLATLIEC